MLCDFAQLIAIESASSHCIVCVAGAFNSRKYPNCWVSPGKQHVQYSVTGKFVIGGSFLKVVVTRALGGILLRADHGRDH